MKQYPVKLIQPSTRRLRFEEIVPLEELCIRLDKCVSVQPGPVDEAKLLTLLERGYDQALVRDPETRVLWGLVETSYLQNLLESGRELSGEDPIVSDEGRIFRIGKFTDIYRLLAFLENRRAVIVVSEADDPRFDQWLGLFTISDLNRHPIRSILYRLFSAAEVGLAGVLERTMADPWDWIKLLNEDTQVRILGFWEIARRKGVDVGPIAALNLANLINIFARSSLLLKLLGFTSRKEFEGITGQISDFRNRIMHPVRPLILGQEDVRTLSQVVLHVEYLREQSEKELQERIGA